MIDPFGSRPGPFSILLLFEIGDLNLETTAAPPHLKETAGVCGRRPKRGRRVWASRYMEKTCAAEEPKRHHDAPERAKSKLLKPMPQRPVFRGSAPMKEPWTRLWEKGRGRDARCTSNWLINSTFKLEESVYGTRLEP